MMFPNIEVALFIFMFINRVHTDPTVNETVVKLFQNIQSLQQDKDSPYKPLFSWETQKGMYQNEIRPNFHGSEKYFLARDSLKIPDNNVFVTAWVTSCLLEAYRYGKAPKPSDQQLKLALDLSDKYKNRNNPHENSEMTFWMQFYNKTADYYQSSPTNLFGIMDVPEVDIKLLEDILELLGLHDIEKLIDSLMKRR